QASSTFTRCLTLRSIPSSTGPGCCSTERPILPRPSARSVPRWRSLWPIWLRTWVIFTFAMLGVVLLLAESAFLRLIRRLDGRGGLFRGGRLSLDSGVRHRRRGVGHRRLVFDRPRRRF